MDNLDPLYRVQPQSTHLHLSIFQPRTVLVCRVNGAITRGARVIPFDTVSSGSYLSVEPGMTLLVGSTAGARDIGKIRIKSITSSEFTVSENSHIAWADTLFLTVLRFWEVWPVYPRIITDPANDEDVIFYKDYDEVYTNQNTILGAFICAGSHRAAWAGEQLYFSASGTSHVAGVSMTYDWAFEGGTSITGSTAHTPGYVQFDNPGHYAIRLIVTGSNGSEDTTYRYVSIYNKEEDSSSNNPPRNWSLGSIGGSRGEGGNRTSITFVNEDANIDDGSVVVLFADDWYGNTNISLGGNAVNSSKIMFSGHVVGSSLRYNYQVATLDFDAANISELMKATETYAISLESTKNPTKWFQMKDINGKKAIYHYLKWHSTVLSIADFEFSGTDQNVQYFDTDRQSVFDAVDNYMRNALMGTLGADRQGKLWAQVGTVMYASPTGSFPTIMTIENRDWIGEPQIEVNQFDTVSYIEVGGVAYSGSTTGTFRACLSQAPGATPNGRGNPDSIPGLTISGQSHLNQISGNLYAQRNAPYPMIEMDMSSGFRNLDIFPIKPVSVNILSADTSQNVEIHAPYIVDSIEWKNDQDKLLLLPSISLQALMDGKNGSTLTIPNVPDDNGFGDNGNGNFGGWNPVVYPAPTLPSSSIRYWTGFTQKNFPTGADAIFDGGYSTLEGDATLLSDLTNPTIVSSGLYMIKFFLDGFDVGTAEQGVAFLSTSPSSGMDGQSAIVDMDNTFLTAWRSEKVGIAWLNAGTIIYVNLVPPYAPFLIGCTLDIVKLG